MKTQEEIQFENRLYDLAHSITDIFHPELSQGSWVFQNHKDRVIKKLLKNKDLLLELTENEN